MKPLDLSKVKVRSIKGRHSKVHRRLFDTRLESTGVAQFVDSLPAILKGADLRALVQAIISAQARRKPILWMFGAHVIKVGLSPILCEIIERGCARMIATNNAGLIHDLELAFFGQTSEDVESALKDGDFGMTQETGAHYAGILEVAATHLIGLGEAAGRYINMKKAPFRNRSVFAIAQRHGVTATVHVAIGTDVVNAHPGYDGAIVGAASQLDFRRHCAEVTALKGGGVALNFGSAVILPEVFLKALAIARNLDPKFTRFTCANFDMIGLYRPRNNFVARPRLLGATTYDFAGHHEIMLPLLWAAVRDRIK